MPNFDKQKFAAYLVQNISAKQFGEGACAAHVRKALGAAGLKPVTWPVPAKDWGGTLLALGFTQVSATAYTPQLGDVIVIQPPKSEPKDRRYGHIEGYDGKNWVSDFVQKDMWPSRAYKADAPAYVIYRRDP